MAIQRGFELHECFLVYDDCYGVCRTSVIRMSSGRKQDVVTKTVEDERIQVGVLRAVVDDVEDQDSSSDEEEEDDEADGKDASDKSDDTSKSGSSVHCLNFLVDITCILFGLGYFAAYRVSFNFGVINK